MAGGRKAYITRIGMPGDKTDMVDIFGYADPDAVGFEQQEEFHKKWILSLRNESKTLTPLPGEIEEAMKHPGG
jgi:hypothetical protein